MTTPDLARPRPATEARPVWVVTIPFAPDPRLSPNSRTSPRTVSGIRARFRRDCRLAVMAQLPPERRANPPAKARLYVAVFWSPRRRTWDDDNLRTACKPLWDALVDAGAIAGDDPSRLETPEVVQHTAKTAQEECMDVEIREAR